MAGESSNWRCWDCKACRRDLAAATAHQVSRSGQGWVQVTCLAAGARPARPPSLSLALHAVKAPRQVVVVVVGRRLLALIRSGSGERDRDCFAACPPLDPLAASRTRLGTVSPTPRRPGSAVGRPRMPPPSYLPSPVTSYSTSSRTSSSSRGLQSFLLQRARTTNLAVLLLGSLCAFSLLANLDHWIRAVRASLVSLARANVMLERREASQAPRERRTRYGRRCRKQRPR